MKPVTVVNLKREQYDHYCGRAGNGEIGYFGNPYRVGSVAPDSYIYGFFPVPHRGEMVQTKGVALLWYADYLASRLSTDKVFQQRVLQLEGRLGCFCAPQACHVDFLAKYINTTCRKKVRVENGVTYLCTLSIGHEKVSSRRCYAP